MKVAVIGAGIVGASIAYSLAKRKVEVHIFDARKELNDPTRYSLAWLNAFNKTPLDYHLFFRLGLYRWPAFHAEIGGGCDLTLRGALALPVSSGAKSSWLSGNQSVEEQMVSLQTWGYSLNRLTKEDVAKLEPNINLSEVAWGIHFPDEGFVDAEKCTKRLLELAQKNGAKLHRSQEVSKLVRQGERIKAISVGGKLLEFDEVILASGTTVADLAQTAEVNVPQKNVPAFLVMTSPCKKPFKNVSVLHIFSNVLDDKFLHLRQNPDGSFWIAEVGDVGQGYGDPEAHAKRIMREFSRFYPPAEKLEFTHRTILLPKPVGGKAIFGRPPGVKNLYVALSHSAVVIASQIGDWVASELLDQIEVQWLKQFRLR